MEEQAAGGGTALVTGGARRLGRAIALALARAGWDIALQYRSSQSEAQSTAAEIRALGRRAECFARDLRRLADPDGWWAAIEAALGPVTCLVNNASLFAPDSVGDFAADAPADTTGELSGGGPLLFDEHMRVNAASPVLLARQLHLRLPAGSEGVVVNLLDQKLWNPNPDFLSYTLSKAALEAANGLLARALAPRVRVVGVAPGITLPSGAQTPEGFAAAHRRTPLGRSSTPQDVARAVVFLVSSPAITGTTLLVDGGQHLLPTTRDVQFLVQ
jgi:NAD(P)-dependent dehydrogenase (short-subunit alcohol dehydrogenase family)